MDTVTHALASYSLARVAFPRLSIRAQIALIFAGTAVDLDGLSYYFGPASYVRFHRTYAHSVSAALLVALLSALVVAFPLRRTKPHRNLKLPFAAALLAAVLHLALDVCEPQPIGVFWPFSTRRLHLDLLARFDLWLLVVLLAGTLLPLLATLVTQEIGARSKSPRGRLGACLALSFVVLFIAARGFLHAEAATLLDSRSYRGESPHQLAAFPDATSPFLWHGIVETSSALHAVDLTVGPATRFDPESATSSYKPGSSPLLGAALQTKSARLLLSVARFPKASIENSPAGFQIETHDFARATGALAGPFPHAFIDITPSGNVLSDSLAWPSASR